jgi:hypothetical protein
MSTIYNKIHYLIDTTLPLYLLIILGVYIYLCTITNYTTDTTKLSQNDKIILLSTTVVGIILNAFILLFHIGHISQYYNENIMILSLELLVVFLLIVLAYYSNIFRNNENDTYSKIASGLWPLLGSFGIIMILSMIAIYNKYNNLLTTCNDLHSVLIPQVKI